MMQMAFKEWAIVIDALEDGRQILILRKGGLREGRAGFQLSENAFWLFPTWFHQQRESVIESAQRRFDEIHKAESDPKNVIIRSFAKVHLACEIHSWKRIDRVSNQHIWREEVIRERFEWGQKKAIFAFVIRVYSLLNPIRIPLIAAYGGCRSWVELALDIPQKGLIPVLDDAAFSRRFDDLKRVIL